MIDGTALSRAEVARIAAAPGGSAPAVAGLRRLLRASGSTRHRD